MSRPLAEPRASGAGAIHSSYERELAFAVATAEAAGRLLMDRYERVERIDYKSARDVVTDADHAAEAAILAAIRAAFPGDGILAEESGEHVRPDGSPATGTEGRSWVVDPLDGTVNYANGIPFFCVSVALVDDGRPVVGAIHDPGRQETYAAAADGPATLAGPATRGGPATLGGRPLTVSDKDRLSDFVVSLALGGPRVASRLRAIRRAVRIPRSMGSAALALAYVAGGRFDAFIQQGGLSAWDVAAAGLIAERAGATVTDLAGGPWFDLARPPRQLGVLAAPPAHHETLLALVQG
jgi:myo-inositol-1(or 4)-monophosphatase